MNCCLYWFDSVACFYYKIMALILAGLFEVFILLQGYHHLVSAHRIHHHCHETTLMHLSMEAHNTAAAIVTPLCPQHSSLLHILPSSPGICMVMVQWEQASPLL